MSKVEQISTRRIDQDELAVLHTPTFLREFREVTTPQEREIIFESQLLDDILKGRKSINEAALSVLNKHLAAYHARYNAVEKDHKEAHIGRLRSGFETLNGHPIGKPQALSEVELFDLSLEAARDNKHFLKSYRETARHISRVYFAGVGNVGPQELSQLKELLPDESLQAAESIILAAEQNWQNAALANLGQPPQHSEQKSATKPDATVQKIVARITRSEKAAELLKADYDRMLPEQYAQKRFAEATDKRVRHALAELYPEHQDAITTFKVGIYQRFQEQLNAKLAETPEHPKEKSEVTKGDGSVMDNAMALLSTELQNKIKSVNLGDLMRYLVEKNIKQSVFTADELQTIARAITRIKLASKGLKKNFTTMDLMDKYGELTGQSAKSLLANISEKLTAEDLEGKNQSEAFQRLSVQATQAVLDVENSGNWHRETIQKILTEVIGANTMTASGRRSYIRAMTLRYLKKLNQKADQASALDLANLVKQKDVPVEVIDSSVAAFLDVYRRYCHVRLQVGQALSVDVKALQEEDVETPALLGELNDFFDQHGVNLASHLNKQEHTNRLPAESRISWNRIPTEHGMEAPFECVEQLPEVLKMGQLYLRYCNERVKDPAVRARLAAEMKLQPGLEDFYFRPATGNDVFRLDIGYPTIYEFDDFPRGLLLTYLLDKFQKGQSGWTDLFRSKLEKPDDTMAFVIHETASGACKYDHQKMAELMGKEEVPATFTTSDEFHQRFERRGNELYLDGKRVTVVWHHLMNTPEAPAIIKTLDECGVTILPHFSHVSHKGWQAILKEDAAAGILPSEFQPLIESRTFPESIRVLSRDQKMTFEGVEYNGLEELMTKVDKDKLVIKVVGAENAEGVMVCASFSKDKYKNLIKYLAKILDKHAIMIQSNNAHTQGSDLVFNSGTGTYEKFSGNITSRVFMDGNGKIISGLSHLTSGSTGHGMVDMAVYSLKS